MILYKAKHSWFQDDHKTPMFTWQLKIFKPQPAASVYRKNSHQNHFRKAKNKGINSFFPLALEPIREVVKPTKQKLDNHKCFVRRNRVKTPTI